MSNNIMLESPAGGAITAEEQTSAPRSLMRQDSKSRWENGWMFPRRWMLPALNSDFSNNTDIFKSKDTSQYRPDELSVSVSDGVLRVGGKHEEKAEDGSKMVSRMFSRKYTLPASAEADQVASNLSSDGVLVITAPKKALAIK